jgi:hypothetical protein
MRYLKDLLELGLKFVVYHDLCRTYLVAMYIRHQLQYLPRNSSALWLLGRVLRKIPGSVFTKNAGGGLIRTLAIKARANLQKMVESQGEFRQKGFARCR